MSRKGFLVALAVIISINLICAIDLEVKTDTITRSIIVELGEPAVFDLSIKNLGEGDSFEIYSLVGVDITPKGPVRIESGDTKKIRINANIQPQLRSESGSFPFEYSIRDSKNDAQKEKLIIEIEKLENALAITPNPFNVNAEKTTITVKNRLDYNFEELKIKLSSAFFSDERMLSLKPLESKDIEVAIDREKMKTFRAGTYIVKAEISTKGKEAEKDVMIQFLEQEDIESSEISKGFIIKKDEITKKNIGNVKKEIVITVERGLFSYLFTTVNLLPTETRINNFKKEYTWKKELLPNEELKVVVKTNWLYPIILILIALGLIVVIKRSVETDLMLRKRVSFVKTKGGQFALKVTLRLKSKKFIERINVIDKLPPLVELYDRFGAISPDKIDTRNRRMEWNIESLSKDEERIFTYIIYSKIGVVGRFELPEARATYEKDGKIKQTTSNRSFFINEPKGRQLS